ncbi:MAG: hypothetical protein AVDCRST_MAG77-4025 [uncultured Chloroflexi bacterium]|uniref:Uncharacterized protein n=1 Tax=uncultured Chloroflexota bacterium TaxID=166587 RepID=A0A6J4JNC0_9CHLR|nr:MAG: hypothetical protein AVDCRST_MAG77-4025 [uncultured Chloroflexota bacterium]
MHGDVPHLPPELVNLIKAALLERQALLTGPDVATPSAQARVVALDARLEALLDQLRRVVPPEAALQDDASAPGDFNRFLDGGAA